MILTTGSALTTTCGDSGLLTDAVLHAPINPLLFSLDSSKPTPGENRFTLRPWRVGDAPELFRAWCDPALASGAPPEAARTVELAAAWISRYEQRALDGLALDLAIAPVDGPVVGEVGVAEFSPVRRAAILGYWIAPEARGRGLATAAVATFCDWAFSQNGLIKGGLAAIGARVAPDNVASALLLEKALFTRADVRPDGIEIWLRRATRSGTRG